MSNQLAIAAVTATLRHLIKGGVKGLPDPDNNITTKPLDKARTGSSSPDQLNIFLYQTMLNAAWRNMDMPRQVRPGETGQTPLALNLYYLITAYGDGDEDTKGHKWLGEAMSVLHDHPVLGAQEIQDAMADSELQSQIERVRITPQPLSLDEISKLWTAFQTQYRISAAYQVEVILIESTRPTRAPLPVLTRGAQDQGINAQSNLVPPIPTLTNVMPVVLPPGSQTSALLGNDLLLTGHDLDGSNISVQIAHPLLSAPFSLPPPSSATATAITVNLPPQPRDLPGGIWTIFVSVKRPGESFSRTTNALPFAIAPQILAVPAINATRNGKQVTVTLACSPMIQLRQRVSLLLGGGDEVPAEPFSIPTENLTFVAMDDPPGRFKAGTYFTRLRVDGVDSLLIDQTVQPPKFQASQTVLIP